MEIEWLGQDPETLAHTSKLRIAGKSAVTPHAVEVAAPHHANTKADEDRFQATSPVKNGLVLAGESLGKTTIENVGYDATATPPTRRNQSSLAMPATTSASGLP